MGLAMGPDEFDEVAAELGRTLDVVKVPRREKKEESSPPSQLTRTR
jgi:hemoglobin